MKASRTDSHLNQKEGMVPKKGAKTPQKKVAMLKASLDGTPQCIGHHNQTPYLNPNPFNHWYGIKTVARVRVNGDSCMALLYNSAQINTIMPYFVKTHSLDVSQLSDLVGR